MLSSAPLPSEGHEASPVALSVGAGSREAWSCPPPNEIFTVGSQGRDEEIAGVGVAVALHRLLVPGSTPVRHASQPLYPVPSIPPAAFTLCAARFWQGWLPALLNETVVPLTGLGAPLVSFPFVDLDHVLPSQGLMRQFVMVLVVRFRMSVAEIVTAYTLVSPRSIEPHHRSQPTPRSRCPSA